MAHLTTAIDGAAGSETTYPASGISSAFIGDLYLNLSTGTVVPMYNHRYGGKSHLEVYDGAIQCRRLN
ncbi:MAG: hypothetical protein ACLTKQ_08565 [Acutalibacteraceae bacterium]